ncbi:MAG TPA: hypothetical protein VKA05_08415, partial [Acidimicrobiales bacterium]|nr:hypothetical protein [Acidimicrobiales bacterium]
VLDGWWVEGCVEGVTGWAVGGVAEAASEPAADAAGHRPRTRGVADLTEDSRRADARRRDAEALYAKLGGVVAPAFFGEGEGFLEVRRSAIALNGSFFNTERMAREYAREAYGLPA